MAPVHITPFGDGDRGAPSAAAAPPRPIGALDLAARAEGPWPRSAHDLLTTWSSVRERAMAVAGAGEPELAALDVPDRFALGVFFAARWTLGLVGRTPLTGMDSPVTDHRLNAEVAIAEYLIESNGPHWDVAAGVRAWLAWIVGVKDEIAYPAPA